MEKFNNKQIIKNYEKDRETNCRWEKTLKYAITKDIPFEHIFSVVAFHTNSLIGLPYFLMISGRIENPNYMYNGFSISLVFEMFKDSDEMENTFLTNGGKYEINQASLSKEDLKKVIVSISDFDILKPILIDNKEFIFEPFKGFIKGHRFECDFSNYVMYSYMNKDFNVVDTLLFDIDLSNEEINSLLYEETYYSSGKSLLLSIIENADYNLLKKLDEKYQVDINKFKFKNNLVKSLLSYYNYEMQTEPSFDEKRLVLDFFLDKGLMNLISEFKNYDKDKFNHNPYIQLSKIFFDFIANVKTCPNVEHLIENSNTIEEDSFFWSLVFYNDFKFLNKYYFGFSTYEKEQLFKHTSELKNIDILNLFLEDNDFDLNEKVKEDIAVSRFFEYAKIEDFDDKIKFVELFLEHGSRTNNIDCQGHSIKWLILGYRLEGTKEKEAKYNALAKKYKDNEVEIISFNLKKTRDKYEDTFGYIQDIMNQLKEMLIKKNFFKEINEIQFKKEVNEDLYFSIDSETIVIPKNNISGNEFTEKTFKRI